MATILKKEVTLESIEEQIKRLQSFVDSRKKDLEEGREINLEELNDKFIEIGMNNRPSLDEIAKTEILNEISYQISEEYSSFNKTKENGNEISAYDFGLALYSDHLSNESLVGGYYMWNIDNERALEAVKHHDDNLYESVLYDVTESLSEAQNYQNRPLTDSEEFGIIMEKAFTEVITSKVEEINSEFDFAELDENLEDYEIDTDNLKLGDVKLIYNNIAEELGEELVYSNEEIAKDILNELEKNKEKDIEKEY
jgi:hypothetical protein